MCFPDAKMSVFKVGFYFSETAAFAVKKLSYI